MEAVNKNPKVALSKYEDKFKTLLTLPIRSFGTIFQKNEVRQYRIDALLNPKTMFAVKNNITFLLRANESKTKTPNPRKSTVRFISSYFNVFYPSKYVERD